ncbi:MAG: thioredoxin domain-containing protein [Candidatus Berkelbacteria bacterium]|nr:thioredoxin domain-containing protein [Candidatus Berkelbacteria bacterium]
MPSSKMIVATTSNFEAEVLKSELPVLVFFYQYFFDCERADGLANSLASLYDGKVKVVKVDRDTDLALAEQCKVDDVPAFIVFNDGEAIGKPLYHADASAIHDELGKVLTSHKPATQQKHPYDTGRPRTRVTGDKFDNPRPQQ